MVSVTPIFVPGDRPERFAKAAASGADAVIIDLEDAVAFDQKLQARADLRAALLPRGVDMGVRINPVGTRWHVQDLEALAGLKLSMVMLAKTETTADIAAVAAATGLPVIALIETANGLARAREIARAPGTMRLAFGSIDFCADIGAAHTREALLAARSELVLASRLANLPPPIDGVTTALDDAALLQDDAAYALNPHYRRSFPAPCGRGTRWGQSHCARAVLTGRHRECVPQNQPTARPAAPYPVAPRRDTARSDRYE